MPAKSPARTFSSHIKRGKVECRLSFQAQAQRSDTLQLNEELLAALSKLGDEVRQRQPGLHRCQ